MSIFCHKFKIYCAHLSLSFTVLTGEEHSWVSLAFPGSWPAPLSPYSLLDEKWISDVIN